MKKGLFTVLTAVVFAATISMTAFAAGWEQEGGRWKYSINASKQGSYYLHGSSEKTGWYWIDSDGDGLAECYGFGEDHYLLTNTTTSDGFTVDEAGAWIVDGVVQTKTLIAGSGETFDISAYGYTDGVSNFLLDVPAMTREELAALLGGESVLEEYESGAYTVYYRGLDEYNGIDFGSHGNSIYISFKKALDFYTEGLTLQPVFDRLTGIGYHANQYGYESGKSGWKNYARHYGFDLWTTRNGNVIHLNFCGEDLGNKSPYPDTKGVNVWAHIVPAYECIGWSGWKG